MGEGRAVREVSYFTFLQLSRMADGQNNTVFTKWTSSSNIHASAEQCIACAYESRAAAAGGGAGEAHLAPGAPAASACLGSRHIPSVRTFFWRVFSYAINPEAPPKTALIDREAAAAE